MEATKDFLNSIIKNNQSLGENDNVIKEVKPTENQNPGEEEKASIIIPASTKPKKEEYSIAENSNNIIHNEEADKIKNSIDNIIPLSSKVEEKPKENKSSKGENINTISISKEEEKAKEKEKEKGHESQKEKKKDEYLFPIPNNNSKLEESKNSDSSYILYKIPQNNFSSLNLNIQDNLRPKNKENQNHQNYNISFFYPITFSCSLNTHGRKSKIKPIENKEEFFEKIIKIADVSNINEFWEVFQHLKKPNQCPTGSDYHIFKKGIVPMWEDKSNKDGGKLSVLLTWKYSNVIWEEVTFNFAKGLLPYYDYINGIVISVRPRFLALSFWIKCRNTPMVEKIRNAVSGLMQAPSSNCFDFIPFH